MGCGASTGDGKSQDKSKEAADQKYAPQGEAKLKELAPEEREQVERIMKGRRKQSTLSTDASLNHYRTTTFGIADDDEYFKVKAAAEAEITGSGEATAIQRSPSIALAPGELPKPVLKKRGGSLSGSPTFDNEPRDGGDVRSHSPALTAQRATTPTRSPEPSSPSSPGPPTLERRKSVRFT